MHSNNTFKLFFSIIALVLFSFTGAFADVQEYIDDLKDEDANVRMDAATALSEMGPDAAPAVPALGKALSDEDAYVRNFAANALAQIGPASVGALTELIAALDHPDVSVSQAAEIAIGAIGPEAKPAIPKLITSLKKWKSGAQGSSAAYALVQIGESAIPALGILAKDPEKHNVLSAIWCLGEIGSTSKQSQAAFLTALKNGHPEINEKAAFTIREKLKGGGVPILTKGLSAYDPNVRKQSAWALGRLGEPAKKAMPKLKAMGKGDRDPLVKAAANWAVLELQGKNE